MNDRHPRPLSRGFFTIRLSALVAGILCSVGSVAAQEGAAASTDFFDTIDVNVVNVEVYVTDKKGNPVGGLSVDDFRVFEDRRPVEVTNFYAAVGGRPAAVSGQDVETIPGQHVSDLVKPESQRLNLILFIDNVNINPQGRNRVLEALRGSLFFQLNADDQVMLASYDGSLNIRRGLTGDPEEIARALDEMVMGSPRGVHATLDRLGILRQLQQVQNENDFEQSFGAGAARPGNDTRDGIASSLLSTVRTYAQTRHRETRQTIAIMQRFVDSLAGIEGRKALIYVSDGLSLRPGEALFQAWEAIFREVAGNIGGFSDVQSESRDTDSTALFEDLGRRANANQVTFHTVLASGERNPAMTLAERGAFANLGETNLGQAWNTGLESIERSNYRGSMQILAKATGGLATLQTGDIGSALQRLKRDLDTYYSLGYVPLAEDGKSHRIRVEVTRPGLQVRHRESYRNKTADEQMSDRTLSALLFETGENPLGVRISFGEEQQTEEGDYLVPVMVRFPIAKVLLLPQEHFHEGRVSIYVGARDGGGMTSAIQKMPAPIRIPNDKLLTALGQVAGFRMTLRMQEGEHSVVVGVRDELANLSSTTREAHRPGGP